MLKTNKESNSSGDDVDDDDAVVITILFFFFFRIFEKIQYSQEIMLFIIEHCGTILKQYQN